ncbi:MAG: hypothetical protein ABW221_05555 [Vicinamibacteria bacterium]
MTCIAKSTQAFDTTTVVSGLSGSMTVATNAPYGRLSGKATTVELPSGSIFETLMLPRAR